MPKKSTAPGGPMTGNSSKKRVSVIGGSGFIGTNLCQILSDHGIPFQIIDLKESSRFPEQTVICDIRDIESLRAAVSGDTVVHLAAVHRDDVTNPEDYETTNVDGTRNICAICAEKNINRIVFTSTVAVYGFAKSGTDENGSIQPFNDYGRTKWRAEEVLDTWYNNDVANHELIVVRPTVVFGEGNRGNVYNLLKQIASGRFVMVGDGTNRKSMAYVGNVAAFLKACITSGRKHGIFNYVDTPDTDMNALVSLVQLKLHGSSSIGPRLPRWLGILIGHAFDVIALLTRRKFPISAIRVKKFTATSSYSSSKHELDGFEPPQTLEMGLERTLYSEFVAPDPLREIFLTE